ncbi:acetylcholine receptor subunit beta-like isoform X2 [Dreissena polymorpha]|uniref:acetylcholine receptor subunit beta-like isoform X2 n=1 Tax=Dreissena polymorpha TaxID=45954 RepID=UPI0022649C78|nr:acetylcholine receptor subunit beta-like isoform X2 [Dreissena polymorpha]
MYVTVFSNMQYVFVRLLILQWSLITCYVASQTADDVKNLTTTLYKSAEYNKKVRPLKDQNEAVVVGTDLILDAIIDFNEREENLKISGSLFMTWTDEFLQWNTTDYGGLEHLLLPQNDIWRPGVRLHNSFRTFIGLGSSDLLLRVSSSGDVSWQPYQECPLKFSSWSYSTDQVKLIGGSYVEYVEGRKGILLNQFDNARWLMENTTAGESEDGFVIYKMTLKRKSTFYVLHMIIPIVLLSFLNVLTFALPISSGERASYAITVFLSLVVFLTIVASEIPKNSNTIPVISVYITAIIALSTTNVITSLLESRLACRDKCTNSIGSGYRKLYRLACICQCKCDEKSDLQTELDWKDVVTALDYFLFWLFCALTCVATVVWFVIANGRQSK